MKQGSLRLEIDRPVADIAGEKLVCWLAMSDDAAARALVGVCEQADFTVASLRTVWQAVEAIVRKGESPHMINVAWTLDHWGKLDGIGGEPFLASLLSEEGTWVLGYSFLNRPEKAGEAIHRLGERRRAALAVLNGTKPKPVRPIDDPRYS